jgi:hypothetical protein
VQTADRALQRAVITLKAELTPSDLATYSSATNYLRFTNNVFPTESNGFQTFQAGVIVNFKTQPYLSTGPTSPCTRETGSMSPFASARTPQSCWACSTMAASSSDGSSAPAALRRENRVGLLHDVIDIAPQKRFPSEPCAQCDLLRNDVM